MPAWSLTILRLQFGTGLSCKQADHEAVVVLWAVAGLCWGRRCDGGVDQWSADDGVCGLPRRSQVILFWVHINGVQADLRCAPRLTLILHSCNVIAIQHVT